MINAFHFALILFSVFSLAATVFVPVVVVDIVVEMSAQNVTIHDGGVFIIMSVCTVYSLHCTQTSHGTYVYVSQQCRPCVCSKWIPWKAKVSLYIHRHYSLDNGSTGILLVDGGYYYGGK